MERSLPVARAGGGDDGINEREVVARHIRAPSRARRLFLENDRFAGRGSWAIVKGEVRVEWSPTKQKIADFMTKPLQGSAFRNFRNLILGLLSMKEAANVLTNDVVSRLNNKGLADKKARHRSVLDYMGECNLEGRRTGENERSKERSERSKKQNERSNKRTKRASK
jgi:hypothetical protein